MSSTPSGPGCETSSSIVVSHLHDLVLELGEEKVDNLVLLDGKRVEVDLLHALYLASLDQTAELGNWLPFLLVALCTTTSWSSASTSTATVTTAVTTGSETTARTCAGCTSSTTISHVQFCVMCRELR